MIDLHKNEKCARFEKREEIIENQTQLLKDTLLRSDI